MVSASLALNITAYIQMFFGAMMCFFPLKLMEGYKGDTFTGGKDTTFFCFAMGIFGLQQMTAVMTGMSSSKSYQPEKEQSVNCFCNAVSWFAFMLIDGRMIFGYPYDDVVGKIIPVEGMSFNMALFATLVIINLLGWQDTGSVMPDFKSFGSAFKGSSRAPMLVYYFNMVWFGVGCGIFTEQMIEFYTPGTMATMGAATNMIYWIMGNAGKVILLNIFTGLSLASVGGEATSYRMLRMNTLIQMMYLGMFSRDLILFEAMKWPNPGAVVSFVQTFGTGFFMAKKLGEIAGSEMTFKKK